jgi:hypothetical protein
MAYSPNIAPPRNYRRITNLAEGWWTKRDPRDGPYGVFIQFSSTEVECIDGELQNEYIGFWQEGNNEMRNILWNRDREAACERIRKINLRIGQYNDQTITERPLNTGKIDLINWTQAGIQLDLAVRDACLYNSHARFEDVRDFIWELILQTGYPMEWAVTYGDYICEIGRSQSDFNEIRRVQGDDIDDGASVNPILTNTVEGPSSSAPPLSPPPPYSLLHSRPENRPRRLTRSGPIPNQRMTSQFTYRLPAQRPTRISQTRLNRGRRNQLLTPRSLERNPRDESDIPYEEQESPSLRHWGTIR